MEMFKTIFGAFRSANISYILLVLCMSSIFCANEARSDNTLVSGSKLVRANNMIIDIKTPTTISNSAITDTTIEVKAFAGVNPSNVSIDSLTTVSTSSFNCVQTFSEQVDCTIVINSSGDLSVSATDNEGNSLNNLISGYVVNVDPDDTTEAVINITAPTKRKTQSITDTSIQIVDNVAISASNVVVSSASTAVVSNFSCSQTSGLEVNCTLSVDSSGDLTISATDDAGNSSVSSERGYVVSVSLGDTTDAVINIAASTKSDTQPITDTTIQVIDDVAISALNVVVSSASTAAVSNFSCSQTSGLEVNCTLSVDSSGDLTISATDDAGNSSVSSEMGYVVTVDIPNDIVTTPVNVLWFGASTTAFNSATWPNYNLPFLVSVMYEQVAGITLPGRITSNTRGGTPLNSFVSRNSCSQSAANGMHLIHGTDPLFERNCSSAENSNNQTYGDQSGAGNWDYIMATAIGSMNPSGDEENGVAEMPKHASEAVYRAIKEVFDYNVATISNAQFMNILITRDDPALINAGRGSGSPVEMYIRGQCIKETTSSYGVNSGILPLGLAFYNAYRAMDTASGDQGRLDQRSHRTGEPLNLEGVFVPENTPLFNLDAQQNSNTNIHYSKHGALLAAMFTTYFIYNVNPLDITMPTQTSPEGAACSSGAELCTISPEQFLFLQHIAKLTVEEYKSGEGWVSCENSNRRQIDDFITNNANIDSFMDMFGLNNTYSDPTGDGSCSAGEDCSQVLFPFPSDFL